MNDINISHFVHQVNKSLRLTANAIQNYSFEKSEKIPTDLADEKDSGISQVRYGTVRYVRYGLPLFHSQVTGKISVRVFWKKRFAVSTVNIWYKKFLYRLSVFLVRIRICDTGFGSTDLDSLFIIFTSYCSSRTLTLYLFFSRN